MQKHVRPAEESDVLIATREVARRLGVSPDTLVGWRRKHFGPRFVIMGRLVRYPASAVDAFIAEQSVDIDAARDRAGLADDDRTLPLPLVEPKPPAHGAEGG